MEVDKEVLLTIVSVYGITWLYCFMYVLFGESIISFVRWIVYGRKG